MDILEEDDNIFTFNVPYDDTADRRSYDEASTIVVDKEKRRIEPFKKLPVLVEDTAIDVGDLIIHNYGTKTPVGTLKLRDLKNAEKREELAQEESCGQSEKESDNENETAFIDNILEKYTDNRDNDDDLDFTNENNNSSQPAANGSKIDDLVELDSSYVTTSDDSPDSTQHFAPPGGQLLGGNAESLSLDFSLTETDCDYHQTSLSASLIARHLPAPRFIAHQMALSISPERYIPKTRPKSNRYSISSSSPSDDGSQFELWAARKQTRHPRSAATQVCIGLLITLLVLIVICIIIIPVVWVTTRPGDIKDSDLYAFNFSGITNYTEAPDTSSISQDFTSSSNDIFTSNDIMSVTLGSRDVTSVSHDITHSSHDITSGSLDVTLEKHYFTTVSHDVTSNNDDVTTLSHGVTSIHAGHAGHEITSSGSGTTSAVLDITSVEHDITSSSDITDISTTAADSSTVTT